LHKWSVNEEKQESDLKKNCQEDWQAWQAVFEYRDATGSTGKLNASAFLNFKSNLPDEILARLPGQFGMTRSQNL
jgi:hypothetical protein